MTEKLITAIVTIFIAIVGVAVIAVLVSPKADTPGVITAGTGGFRDLLCTALSPIGACPKSLTEQVTSTIHF